MENFFNGLIGFVFALMAISGCVFIGFVIYLDGAGVGGILSLVIATVVGLAIGVGIMKTTLQVGTTSLLSVADGAINLGKLPAVEGEDYRFVTPTKLVALFENKKLKNTKGLLRIWGSKRTKNLAEWQEIKSMHFDEEKALLQIDFYENNQLLLTAPNKVLVSATNFSIVQAKEVLWKWEVATNVFFKAKHTYSPRKIHLEWKQKSGFDSLSAGSPAINFLYDLNTC